MRHATKFKHLNLVDLKTGEVLNGSIQLQIARTKLPAFICLFKNAFPELSRLSKKERIVFDYFCLNMDKGNEIKGNAVDIARSLRICKSTLYQILASLKQKEFIKGKWGQWMINPSIVLQGGSRYYLEANKKFFS